MCNEHDLLRSRHKIPQIATSNESIKLLLKSK